MSNSTKAMLVFLLAACVVTIVVASCSLSQRRPETRLDAQSERPASLAAEATPARATAIGEPIRIAAWNIEWLGTPDSRSGPAKGHAQSAADLADYIAAGHVDILGLEEIARDEEHDVWTSPSLTAAFATVSSRNGGDWHHRLYPARSGRNQLTGIAWDATRVTAVGEPVCVVDADRKGTAGEAIWPRPPYGQMFSMGQGRTDFVVVVVHLKSDYGGSYSVQRAEEADALMAGLPKAFSDPDVVIIGDFNCANHYEPAAQRIVASGFVDANGADQPTHTRYGPLDRAMLPAAQPEFAARHFEVFREAFLTDRQLTELDFKTRFSDHFMIVTELTVSNDDD